MTHAIDLDILKSSLVLKDDLELYNDKKLFLLEFISNIRSFLTRLNKKNYDFIDSLSYLNEINKFEDIVSEVVVTRHKHLEEDIEPYIPTQALKTGKELIYDLMNKFDIFTKLDVSVDNFCDFCDLDFTDNNIMQIELNNYKENLKFSTDESALIFNKRVYFYGPAVINFSDWDGIHFTNLDALTGKDSKKFKQFDNIHSYSASIEKKTVHLIGNMMGDFCEYAIINPKILAVLKGPPSYIRSINS